MKVLGNVLWLLLGGLILALCYWVYGLLMCVTIVGIPFGVQLFKLGALVLGPFGRDLRPGPNDGGCLQVGFNVLWVLCGWWELALMHLLFGVLLCCTIVGIPMGVQHFKLAVSTVFPFGKQIVECE